MEQTSVEQTSVEQTQGSKIPDKYKHCARCSLSLGIVAFSDTNGVTCVKFLANSPSVVLSTTGGFHLKKSCIPVGTSEYVSEVANFVTGFSISKEINREREVEISKCPICMSSILQGDPIDMVELPCKHMICAECLVGMFRSFQSMLGQGTFKCPICKFNILHNIKEEALRTASASAAPPQPPTLYDPEDLVRTYSSGFTLASLSAPPPMAPPLPSGFGVSPHGSSDLSDDQYAELGIPPISSITGYQPAIPSFEGLRMGFFGESNPVEAQQVLLNIADTPRIPSKFPIGLSCTTQLLGSGYNDLVASVFKSEPDGLYHMRKLINFGDRLFEDSQIKLEHSGDSIDRNGEHNVLKHFILFKDKPSQDTPPLETIMIPLDIPCDPRQSSLTSVHVATIEVEFRRHLDHVISLGDQTCRPKYIVMFAQVTYIATSTLRMLSPHMAPSSAFLSTSVDGLKTINACDWRNDAANMTTWGSLLIY